MKAILKEIFSICFVLVSVPTWFFFVSLPFAMIYYGFNFYFIGYDLLLEQQITKGLVFMLLYSHLTMLLSLPFAYIAYEFHSLCYSTSEQEKIK
jgi:hypothetical protein